MHNIFEIIVVTLVVFCVGIVCVAWFGQSNRVEQFANDCAKAGGIVTQISMGVKSRYQCSVTSLNHY